MKNDKKRSQTNSFVRLMASLICTFLLFSAFLFLIFGKLYTDSKNNVIQIYRNDVQNTVSDFDFYFNAAINAVTFCGNNMTVQHKDGATKEDLERSMVIMSDTFMSYIKDNIAGAYGYVYGDYIDGHHWVPDASYDPTSRSWYIEAKKNPGELVCVPPYIDAESGKVCLTLSQTLSDDPDSVVAFDIALDTIQNGIDKRMQDDSVLYAKIIDRDLKVIVISDDHSEALSTYQKPGDILENADTLEYGSHVIRHNGRSYIVFIESLAIGWDYVCIYDYTKLLGTMGYLYIASGLAIIIFVVIIFIVFRSFLVSQKNMTSLMKRTEIDAMTGIRNRGSGEKLIDQIISDGIPGVLLMLDIDKFKSINDTFGHKIGDQVIISAAHCLQETTRKNDVVMRLGGDEFVCFLYNAQSVKDAELYAKRLFSAIEHIRIDKIPEIRVMVSVGAAYYDGNERIDFSELYRRADEKVYESKKIAGNALSI